MSSRYSHDHQSPSDWIWRARLTQAKREWQLFQSAHHRRLFAVSRAETPDRVEYVVQDEAQSKVEVAGYAAIPEGEVFETLEGALKRLRGEDDDE